MGKSRRKHPKSHIAKGSQGSRYEEFKRIIHRDGDIRRGISRVRSEIPRAELAAFVKKLCENPIYRALLVPTLKPTTFGRLRPRLSLLKCEEAKEIVWTGAIIGAHVSVINEFLSLKEKFNSLFLGGQYNEAADCLENIKDKFGYSIWFISAKLLLSQRANGLSAQKEFLDEIVADPTVDVLTAYLSFLMSYSLEEGVTLQDLRRDMGDSEDGELSEYISYFRHHISPLDVNSTRSPAFSIWIEEPSALVDRYETFISMCQILVARGSNIEAVSESLEIISNVDDQRVKNLNFILSLRGEPSVDENLLIASDAYTVDDLPAAERALTSGLHENADAAWLFELAGRAGAKVSEAGEACLAQEIIDAVHAFSEMTTSPANARAALEGLAISVRGTRAATLVAAICDRELEPVVAGSSTLAQRIAFLSGPLVQPYLIRVAEEIRSGAADAIYHCHMAQESISSHLQYLTAKAQPNVAEQIGALGLWYDEVLFETLRPDLEENAIKSLVGDLPRRDFYEISDVFVGLNRRVPEDVTGTVSNRLPMGYPRWGGEQERYDYPDPENALEFAHNQLLRAIEAEKGVERLDGIEVERAEGDARVAVDAIALWDRVNRHLPCVLQANAHEKLAIEAAAKFRSSEPAASTSMELFDAIIPSLADVGWSEVAELRRQGGFQSLRAKIEEASALAPHDVEEARRIFTRFEDDTVNFIVDKFRPRVRKVALEAALSNLPGFPVFNPFSLFFGSRDTGMAIKNSRELAWIYLLRDIRGAALPQVKEDERQ